MSPSKGLPAPSSPTGFDMVASSHNLLPSYQQGPAEEGRGQARGTGSCPRLGRVLCRVLCLGPALEASSQVRGSMSHKALVLPAHPYLWLGGTDGATQVG